MNLIIDEVFKRIIELILIFKSIFLGLLRGEGFGFIKRKLICVYNLV